MRSLVLTLALPVILFGCSDESNLDGVDMGSPSELESAGADVREAPEAADGDPDLGRHVDPPALVAEATAGTAPEDLSRSLSTLAFSLERLGVAAGTANDPALTALIDSVRSAASSTAPIPERALCTSNGQMRSLLSGFANRGAGRDLLEAAERATIEICASKATPTWDQPLDWEPAGLTPGSGGGSGGASPHEGCVQVGVTTFDKLGPRIVHSFEGYQLSVASAVATLDEGHQLAVDSSCTDIWYEDGKWHQLGAALEIEYAEKDGILPFTKHIPFVEAGGDVPFPDLDLEYGAVVRYRPMLRSCDATCTEVPVDAEQEQVIRFVPAGTMCQVDYQYSQFTINDRHAEAGTWQSSRAVDMTLGPAISDWGGTFKAYARIPEKVGETTMPDGSTLAFYQSTFPYYGELGLSDFFAIHRDDRFSLFEFESTDEDLARLKLIRHVGALEMSALRYPRVEGSNFVTGEAFTYTCSVPPIVRDTVAMCQDIDKPVDSFYLLPYQGSHYTVQGNFGLISHDGDYAYDFEGALSAVADPVLAARRGVVIAVEEEYSGSCPVEQTCNNNLVYIRHQDGSVARYLHFATDQVAVEVGDIVERGTLLGTMGMVGVAAMDHLHFEVHEGAHDVLALFDDVDDPCVEPKGPADNRKSTLTSGETTTLQYKLHPEKGMPAKR